MGYEIVLIRSDNSHYNITMIIVILTYQVKNRGPNFHLSTLYITSTQAN